MSQFDRAWYWESRHGSRAVLGTLLITCAMFVAQVFLHASGRGGWMIRALALSADGIRHGRIWQVVTYLLLHGGFGHLLMNMVGLAMLGPEVERRLGTVHFVALYLGSGVLGGIGYLLIEPRFPCVGASGSVFGVMAAFAALYPRRPMMLVFLPFFSLPAWLMVLAIVALELGYLAQGVQGGIAHAAHLAGAAAGIVYARTATGALDGLNPLRRLAAARPRRAGPPADGRALDELLDKISRSGLHSLTPAERRRLEEASRRLRGWER